MNTEMLVPLQSGLRLSPEELEGMHEFAREGGVFNEESLRQHNPKRTSLIAICRVKANGTGSLHHNVDGYHYFVRDGLHRCCIIHLLGGLLREGEYFVEDRRIEEFQIANIVSGWVTPFDPILEVRLPDFHTFKDQVNALPMSSRLDYIFRHKDQYCTPRLECHARISCFLENPIFWPYK